MKTKTTNTPPHKSKSAPALPCKRPFAGAHLLFWLTLALWQWCGTLTTFAQIPQVQQPQVSTFEPVQINSSPKTNTRNPTSNNPNQLDVYEQDKLQRQKQNAELYEALHGDNKGFSRSINYDLPSYHSISTTEHYRAAFEKLNNMLNGTAPMSLKKAVFLVENAYFEGKLDEQQYNKQIGDIVSISKLKAKQDGFNWKNPLTRNVMLFRALSDTLKVKDPSHEGYITSYPMKYDFNDYLGKQDWSKMFVTKLLASKSGQCHSLPLLYLILAEETKTQANLSFSPSHSYVKFKDPSGNWHNLELTNGRIVSDAYISGSGYVTAEALKNHIYMDTLSVKQTVAYCLADLAKGYTQKFGYDKFVSQCVDTTLKYAPNNIFARQIKSDYQTYLFQYVVNQTERPRPEILKAKYPRIYYLLAQRNQTYEIIDKSGFQEMPEQAYQDWLNSVNKEKEKQEHQGQMFRLTRTMK